MTTDNDVSTTLMKRQSTAIIETASGAAAAAAKAEIEAQYAIAFRSPRHIEQARVTLLNACKRPRFAEKAIYRKPVGKKKNDRGEWVENVMEGLSIRAAEEAIRAMGNIRIASVTVYEDDDIRKKKVTVTDLESNICYNREITLNKTVEKRQVQDFKTQKWGPPYDREVISERKNTQGATVYICKATEDELTIKEAALTSKIIRTEGMRLVPSDIQEEALEQCYATQKNADAEDPKAAMRRIIDAFAGVGVMPEALEKFLGHPVDQVQAKELISLRQMFQAISEGEATWASFTTKPETDEPPPPKGPPPSIRDRAQAGKKGPETTPEPPPATTEPEKSVDDQIAEAEQTMNTTKFNKALRANGINVDAGEDWKMASAEKKQAVATFLKSLK